MDALNICQRVISGEGAKDRHLLLIVGIQAAQVDFRFHVGEYVGLERILTFWRIIVRRQDGRRVCHDTDELKEEGARQRQ